MVGGHDGLDRQSRAFRENAYPTRDDEIELMVERVHEPIRSPAQLLLPEDWEAVRWDSERRAPKTLDEARQALADRIADPLAPDGSEVANAYDGLY